MTDAAASTTQTGQQSSGDQSQSGSGLQQADGASLTTTTSQQASRPEYVLDESHWDAATGTVKPEYTAAVTKAFEIAKAQEERLAALPKDEAGYKIEPPKDYKIPEGFEIQPDHPLAAPLRAVALKHQLPQEAVSDMVAMFGTVVGAAIKEKADFDAAQVAALGSNGATEVTALKTFMKSFGGEAGEAFFKHDLTADQIRVLQKMQKQISSQGGGSYTNGGREPPEQPKPSMAQRMYGATTPQQRAS